jgi:hypothetical protein
MSGRGSSDIAILRLEVISKVMQTFMTPPNLALMNMFESVPEESSSIKWESQRGGRGMTPFVAPGAPAPITAPHGVAQHTAEAAYWKEKMPFDEEFLNNLRDIGSTTKYLPAKRRLARELFGLKNRSDRRKEWMFAKMLFAGGFTYKQKKGYQSSVDYDIPTDHVNSLTSAYRWDTGGSRDIMGNIQDGKLKIKNSCGGLVDFCFLNTNLLKYVANDTTLRDLLKKSAFGEGDLFKGNKNRILGVNPKVLGSLLDIENLVVYDEMYEVRGWLTAAVTAASTTWITVHDISDFEANATIRFYNGATGAYEDCTSYSIDVVNSRIQLSAPPAASYQAGRDYVVMTKSFCPDDTFVMMSSKVDGQSIAEYREAPFGTGRHWGQYIDKNDEWDPEVTWIRVQDKGLPVLFQRDAIYRIDAVQTTEEAATTTTTTTSSSSTTTTTA